MQQQQPRSKNSKQKLYLGLTSVVIISLIGGATIANLLSNTPLLKQELSSTDAAAFRQDESFSRNILQVPIISKPINILLLGIKTNLSDVKNNDGKKRKQAGYDAEINTLEGLSDTMMLIRFDPSTNKIVVFGIPRDTKVEVNGKSEKINAIDHESGIAEAAKIVSK